VEAAFVLPGIRSQPFAPAKAAAGAEFLAGIVAVISASPANYVALSS